MAGAEGPDAPPHRLHALPAHHGRDEGVQLVLHHFTYTQETGGGQGEQQGRRTLTMRAWEMRRPEWRASSWSGMEKTWRMPGDMRRRRRKISTPTSTSGSRIALLQRHPPHSPSPSTPPSLPGVVDDAEVGGSEAIHIRLVLHHLPINPTPQKAPSKLKQNRLTETRFRKLFLATYILGVGARQHSCHPPRREELLMVKGGWASKCVGHPSGAMKQKSWDEKGSNAIPPPCPFPFCQLPMPSEIEIPTGGGSWAY